MGTALITANSPNYSVSTLYVSYLNGLRSSFPVSYLPPVSLFPHYQDAYSVMTLISPELLLTPADYFNSYHARSFANVKVASCLGPMNVLDSLLILLPTEN